MHIITSKTLAVETYHLGTCQYPECLISEISDARKQNFMSSFLFVVVVVVVVVDSRDVL